jgi:predicted RecB family nuclease
VTTRYDVSEVPLQGGYVAKNCPVKAQNDFLHPAEPIPVDPFTQRLFDSGNAFEVEVFNELRGLHPKAVVIDKGAKYAEAQAETLAAMQSDASLILGGWLPSDPTHRRVGKPDILVRAEGGGYRPIDVKWHQNLEPAAGKKSALPGRCSPLESPSYEDATIDEESAARKKEDDVLQLAHYQRMLEAIGMEATDSRWGGIIGVEQRVVWYDLDAPIWRTPSVSEKTKMRTTMERYDFEFDFRLDIIAVAAQYKQNPETALLVVPVKISDCDRCPWWDYCRPQLERGSGDVSLLPRVGWTQWKFHRDRGVTNRAELAALDVVSAAERYEGMTPKALQEQVDQARAALGAAPAYCRRGVTTIAVARADVEVDVDMESIATGCYLWGTLVSRSPAATARVDAEDGYRAFVTWQPMTPEVEAANASEFWNWLMDLRRQTHDAGLTFTAYCWNENAENTYLRRLGHSAGIEEEIETFIASDEWVDLLKVWDSQMITGHGSGLKIIAPICGFHWQVEDAGGGTSMLKYDLGAAGDDEAREWSLTYNRGDVDATMAVREWLSSSVVPGIEDVVS